MSNNILSESDYEVLHKLMTGELSYEDFRTRFLEKVNFKYVLSILNLAKVLDDSDLYRNALSGFGSLLNDDEKLLMYRVLILDKWHREHEEIIMALQVGYKSEVDNILFIEKAIKDIPFYLRADDDLRESFIRKCMYALAAHPKPYSTEVLRKFTESRDEIISKLAKDQL